MAKTPTRKRRIFLETKRQKRRHDGRISEDEMKKRIGLYPGTFDPITNGHMDIIQRAMRTVDKLIVAVARNAGKGPLFSTDERVEMVEDEMRALVDSGMDIEVRSFDTLLMHFAVSVGAGIIIRGLRAV